MLITSPAPMTSRLSWSTTSLLAAMLLASTLSVAATLVAEHWLSEFERREPAAPHAVVRLPVPRALLARPDTSVPDAAAALRGRVFDLDEMAPTF